MDEFANILFGILILICMPIGGFCNSIVLYYNLKISRNTPSLLYGFIAGFDLLTVLIRSPLQVWELLKPETVPILRKVPTVYEEVISVFYLSTNQIIGFLISLLAIVRFVAIIAPFWSAFNLNKIRRFLFCLIIVFIMLQILVLAKNVSGMDSYWLTPCQWCVPKYRVYLGWLINAQFYAFLTIASVFSMFTIIFFLFQYFVRSQRRDSSPTSYNQAQLKSCYTIFLMNFGTLLWLGIWAAVDHLLPQSYDQFTEFNRPYAIYYLYYVMTTLFPILLSTYNSLILCLRSSDMRRLTGTLISSCAARVLGINPLLESDPTTGSTCKTKLLHS